MGKPISPLRPSARSPVGEKAARSSGAHEGVELTVHRGSTPRRDHAGEVISTLIIGVVIRSNGMELRKGNV